MRQTASPDNGRSLRNFNLDLRYENFRPVTTFGLDAVGGLEKQSQCFDEVLARVFNRQTFASVMSSK
jgi:hypothetical protein